MTEAFLAGVAALSLIIGALDRRAHAAERARLLDAALARNAGELVALRRADADRRQTRIAPPEHAASFGPSPIGL